MRDKAALILKDPHSPTIVFGQIEQISDSGVFFCKSESGPMNNSTVTFYPKARIDCVVDSGGHVLVGDIPEKFELSYSMEWEVKQIEDSLIPAQKLFFESDKRFAYCLPPGTYFVRNIKFNANIPKYVDEALHEQEIIFRVDSGKANYIGSFTLDPTPLDTAYALRIPYEATSRPAEFKRKFLIGLAFGLVGSAFYDYFKEVDYDPFQAHWIEVNLDLGFKSITSLPTKTNPPKLRQKRFYLK